MKFNEKLLKKLLQNETTEWSCSDLSWFDDALFLKIENKQLSQSEHDKIIEMMAHDQAVMNQYIELKQRHKIKPRLAANNFFNHRIWALICLFTLTVMIVLWNNPITTDSQTDDLNRGTPATQTVPAHQVQLNQAPEYFIVPRSNQPVRVELKFDGVLVWQSEWQHSQRFLLPISVRAGLSGGEYQWRVITKTSDQVYTSGFTLQN